ncbi:MAG: leucine-rich repeat domain-containing protein [Ruminococcus sp.]|nr:leucine-rich repeat domain-containing protein [Ruminococcus sp.]
MATLSQNVTIAARNINQFRSFFNGSITHLDIPKGTTAVRNYAFYYYSGLASVCFPNSLKSIGNFSFERCNSLAEVILPEGFTTFGHGSFYNCPGITDLTIPSTVQSFGQNVFFGCSSMVNVTIADGFNASGLDLSPSTRYTAETIVSWLNALADRTGQTAYTLTIGSTNLAKLTAEEIAIATNKNWNLA